MKNPNRFYTYAYLREDRTPYYIGKGCGKRLHHKYKNNIKPPKDKTRIIFLKQNLTEEEAFKHEKYMIAVFGRKDLETGILRNRTNGGEGSSGLIHTEEHKIRMSKLSKGENNPVYGKRLWNDGNGNSKFCAECPGPDWVLGECESHKVKKSEITKGRKWWNDGNGNSKFCVECPGPDWIAGATEETKNKIGKSTKGKLKGWRWWNDGCGNHIRSVECPGPNWVLGINEDYKQKLSEVNKGLKWWNDGCGNTKFTKECPGEGWILGRGKFK